MPRHSSGAADRLLVVEIALGVLLFALAVGFFIIPAAQPSFVPGWWAGILLAILFFAIVIAESMRRRRGTATELYDALDEIDTPRGEQRTDAAP